MQFYPPPAKPPMNDKLYQTLSGDQAHTLEHYMRKPLIETGLRARVGLPDQKGSLPKTFNIRRDD